MADRIEELKQINIPPPAEDLGYNQEEVESIIPPQYLDEFYHWMRGQTMGVAPSGKGVIYTYDLVRWMRQRNPIFD